MTNPVDNPQQAKGSKGNYSMPKKRQTILSQFGCISLSLPAVNFARQRF